MFHALAPADSGAMNNLATSLSDDSFLSLHCVSNKIVDLQRDIIGERTARDNICLFFYRFFFCQAHGFLLVKLSIYSVSNFNNVFCTFYDYYFIDEVHGRPSERNLECAYHVFLYSSSVWCVGRRRYNVCHNSTSIRAELLHYNLTLYICGVTCAG